MEGAVEEAMVEEVEVPPLLATSCASLTADQSSAALGRGRGHGRREGGEGEGTGAVPVGRKVSAVGAAVKGMEEVRGLSVKEGRAEGEGFD